MTLTGGSSATTTALKSLGVKVSGGSIALSQMTPGDTVAVRLQPDPSAAGLYALDTVSDLSVGFANSVEGTITSADAKKDTVTISQPQGGSVIASLSPAVNIYGTNGSTGPFSRLSRGLPIAVRGFFNQRTHKMFNVTKVQILHPVRFSWSHPVPIVYGTALSSAQFTATSTVPGTFTYVPGAGTKLAAGSQTLTATFQPTDSVHYLSGYQVRTTLTVMKATPNLDWATPSAISYGMPLSSSQLDATADVTGTFSYSPAGGTILGVGVQALTATFTPTDAGDYVSGGQTQTSLTVSQATPNLLWTTPDSITYGTALSGTELDAIADVAGTFTYSPAEGAVLGTGVQTLTATFTPSDAIDYASGGQIQTSLTVNQAPPSLSWATPDPIVYGTTLSSTQLDATADVPGTFTYSPSEGTVLGAGVQTLETTFTPTDAIDYVSGGQVQTYLTVNQAIPNLSWTIPDPISYGTALASTELDAIAEVAGTFTYSPAEGAVLGTGVQTLTATFTPSDAIDYASGGQVQTYLTVNQAIPNLSWTTPDPISYGTALSSTQLDATTDVPGTFTYSPPAGTIPPLGNSVLIAAFAPTDTTDFSGAETQVTLTVIAAQSRSRASGRS